MTETPGSAILHSSWEVNACPAANSTTIDHFLPQPKKIKNNHEKSYKMLNDQSGENKKGIGWKPIKFMLQ